jgi:hypothetical protein
MPRLNFAANITRQKTRWPPTLPWETICAHRGTFGNDGDDTASRGWAELLRVPSTSTTSDVAGSASSSAEAIEAFATRLRRLLIDRRVLCDPNAPCTVRVEGQTLQVCLPESLHKGSPTRGPRPRPVVCEPYGEMWQQLGGEVGRFASHRTTRYKLLSSRRAREDFERAIATGTAVTALPASTRAIVESQRADGCASFDLARIAHWLGRVRSQPPFVSSGRNLNRSALAPLLREKSRKGYRAKASSSSRGARGEDSRVHAREFLSWLQTSPSGELASSYRPRQYRSCAVVGSGHDLRCGKARGAEIDETHDAIFRSNSAQHRRGERGFEGSAHARELQRHYAIDPARGGERTTFRVNCLFGGLAALPRTTASTRPRHRADEPETCIIARAWFGQPWGVEGFNNLRHPCCSNRLLRSSYNVSRLRALEMGGARFAFFGGVASGDDSIDAMLAGSGGNALHAALALCERVDVYGLGLYSGGAHEDKVYAHAYDERVGQCLQPGSRVYEFGNAKGLGGFFAWRRDRVRTEILMHVLHALGIVRWVQ